MKTAHEMVGWHRRLKRRSFIKPRNSVEAGSQRPMRDVMGLSSAFYFGCDTLWAHLLLHMALFERASRSLNTEGHSRSPCARLPCPFPCGWVFSLQPDRHLNSAHKGGTALGPCFPVGHGSGGDCGASVALFLL